MQIAQTVHNYGRIDKGLSKLITCIFHCTLATEKIFVATALLFHWTVLIKMQSVKFGSKNV